MKRILMVVAGIMAWSLTVSAETVTQALVAGWEEKVYVYDIDEQGAWTKNRVLVNSFPSGTKVAHAIYKNGVVYVNDHQGNAFSGGILKYTLAGEYLGRIDIDGSPEGLAITPDGTTLFASEFKATDGERTCYGRIFKIDLATETVELFCDLPEPKGDTVELRDIDIDNNGHLFVTNRRGKFLVFNYLDPVNPGTPIATQSFASCQGVTWNPDEDLVYVFGAGTWGIFRPDGSVYKDVADLTGPNWMPGAGMVNGKVHVASFSTGYIYELDADSGTAAALFKPCSRTSGVAEIVRDDFAWQTWALDEANGKATAGSEDSDVRFSFYDGVRMSASGVRNGCAVLADATSRLVTDGSASLVPATGDFAVFFWVGGLSGLATGGSFPIFSNGGTTGNFSLVVNSPGTDNVLGLHFAPADGSSAVDLASTVDLADGAWHQVGAVRRGDQLQLWCDGERVAAATVTASLAIATDRTWVLTGSAGTAFDELVVTTDVPFKMDLERLYASYDIPESLPTLPAAPVATDLPAELGTEIAHAYANETEISMPSFAVDGNGTYWVSVETGNEEYDAHRKTTIRKSTDQGATWTTYGELSGQSVSLFVRDGVLCAVGLKAGLGYPASARTVVVWTTDGNGTWTEASSITLEQDGRLLPSPAEISNSNLVLAVSYLAKGTTWSPAVLRFEVGDGPTFSNPRTNVNTRGFVNSNASGYSTLAKVLGGNAITIGKNYVTMFPVLDRHATCPEIPFGPERAAYQNFLGSGDGTYSTYRYNQFRGGSKPFNVRYDSTSRCHYSVTVPSLSMSEIATADPETVVGRLALYASPDIDRTPWYPCGVLDESETYGFVAPTFAFDGNDLLVVYAVSAPDGCDVRGRTHANFLAFRRFANFRTTYAIQQPGKQNRTRAYLCSGKQIFKYYCREDGEWEPDGTLVNNCDEVKTEEGSGGKKYSLTDPWKILVRGKRIFVLSGNAKPGRFFEFDLNGNMVRYWLNKNSDLSGLTPIGYDVSSDCSYALLACGDQGVYKVTMDNNTWVQLAPVDGTVLKSARDVAILPNGEFFVSNYDYGSGKVISHFAADGTALTPTPALGSYYTGLTTSLDGGVLYSGGLRGEVWQIPVADMTTAKTIREKYGDDIFLGSSFLNFSSGQLMVGSRPGFTWVYDPKTQTTSAPFVQLDSQYGIAVYKHNKRGLLVIFR